MKHLINDLYLVYPPFSNQEGDWLWQDLEVRDFVKRSKLYMIVHREEIKFQEYQILFEEFGFIEFRLVIGEYTSPKLRIDLKDVMMYMADDKNEDEIDFELGDKLFRVSVISAEPKILFWFTPDKLIFDYQNGLINIKSMEKVDIQRFTTYDLLYVGISKKRTSFVRLFKTAHEKRLKILTNESSKNSNSRLSDELTMLLFDISETSVKIITSIDDLDNNDKNNIDHINVISEAEKAFVYFLESKYNEIKFVDYPKYPDGLSNQDLTSYSFRIMEDIKLKTDKAVFVGSKNPLIEKDFIIVQSDKAKLYKKE